MVREMIFLSNSTTMMVIIVLYARYHYHFAAEKHTIAKDNYNSIKSIILSLSVTESPCIYVY